MSKGLRFMPRDFAILAFVGKLGMADRDMIQRRFWPEGKTLRPCQDRMRGLAEHGLVRVFKLKVSFAVHSGTDNGGQLPNCYALTPRGADVLEHHTGVVAERVLRSDPAAATLLHRHDLVMIRLAWDEACGETCIVPPAWILEQDRRKDVSDDAPPVEHRILYHAFGSNKKRFTYRPDAAALTLVPKPTAPDERVMLLTYFEADRSTEGHKQLRAKLPGIDATLKSKGWRRYWPHAAAAVVRILWICRTPERLANMLTTFNDLPRNYPFRMACFADAADSSKTLTSPIWHDLAGDLRPIIRLPLPTA